MDSKTFHPQSASDAVRQGETILVVDDENSICEIVQLVLERRGYQLLIATSGREALEVETRHDGPIHLLITDLVMPEMTGSELIDALRVRNRHLKVLMMSGYTSLENLPNCRNSYEFIQKPFSPISLAKKVRDVLDA